MPRQARIVIPGEPHHITQRGNRRQNIFFKDKDRLLYLELLRDYCQKRKVEVISYCLMTNHVHLILVPSSKDSLHRVLKPVHMQYATYINKRFNWTGHLWQSRFFSSTLYDDYFWTALRYVERNPVEAHMVPHACDYPWSSAASRCLGAPSKILTQATEWKRKLDQVEGWYSWLSEPNDTDSIEIIRQHTLRDIPSAPADKLSSLSSQFNRYLGIRKVGRPRKQK